MSGFQQLRLWIAEMIILGAINIMPKRAGTIWRMNAGHASRSSWGDW
jgi:hypothetical protein